MPLTGCDEFETETYYTVDETARRRGASPDEETQDGAAAYARCPPSQPARYRDGLLPG